LLMKAAGSSLETKMMMMMKSLLRWESGASSLLPEA